MSFLGPINLPPFILAHAVGLTAVGLYLIFKPFLSSARPSEDTSPLGIATVGLGLGYLGTAYVPIEQNQFLWFSAPARIVLAGLAGVRLLLDRLGRAETIGEGKLEDRRKEGLSSEAQRALWGILVYDGLGVFLGWWLGEGGFLGRALVY